MADRIRISGAFGLYAFLLALIGAATSGSSANVVDEDLYATTVAQANGWTGESSAESDPGCSACPCNSGDSFAYNDSGDPYLHATNFTSFTLPAGYEITKVTADIMCRYDANSPGSVRIRYYLNGSDAALGDFFLPGDPLTTCRYRTGGATIPAPANGWTATAVNSLELRIKRNLGANTTRLRVKAFKLTVTYRPIDRDSDGVPDINDCAPMDPTIATPRTFYRDADGDGFGNPGNTTEPLCQLTPPVGYVATSTDCNDGNALINPNTIWYLDADGDGFGDPSVPSSPQCVQPAGYVLSAGDQCPTDPDKQVPGPCGCEIPETDVNQNTIPDCVEATSILRTVWSTSVPNAQGWEGEPNAASAAQPTCGESCNCDSGGSYATATDNGQWLEATDFASMNIPAGFTGANVRVDVQCRGNSSSNCTIRVEAFSGSTQTYLRETTFSTADGDGQCRFRLGRRGYMMNSPTGGWTASALEGIRVRVWQGTVANTLRVKSFRVQALLVDRDTDHDGLTDTVDPCPAIPNGSVDCNGNGLGDACEIALSPSTRDVNGDGVLDSCQGFVGWIGGASGSFSSASSWSSGVSPGASSNVFLATSGGATLTLGTSAPTTISSLTIESGTVRLNLGANFVVTGGVRVSPGAALIIDGISANRFFDVAGALRVWIGAKLEIGSLASVRVGSLGSMVTDPLTTLSIGLRGGTTPPLDIQGGAQFQNGVIVKFGSIAPGDLWVGRQFPLISAASPSTPLFRSLGTQSSIEGKFLRSVSTSSLGGGLLSVEVALQSDFVKSVGGGNESLGATSIPTALVARNFTAPADTLDDIAVCARKYNGSGVELPGALFVFRTVTNGSTTTFDVVEYPTAVGPVAIDSADLDVDGDLDVAVLCTVSGTVQVFLNGAPSPTNPIDRFTLSPVFSSLTAVGDDTLAISTNFQSLKEQLLVSSHSALVGNSGSGTLRAIAYFVSGPIKGNPVPTSPLGPPGPSSPIDDTSRTDGWFACSFQRAGDLVSGSIAKVSVQNGPGGLPVPVIDGGSIRSAPDFPVKVASGNFNLDGFEDVLVIGTSGEPTNPSSSVAIYAGASVEVFGLPGSIGLSPNLPLDVTIGRFDTDGKSDFIIAFGSTGAGGEQGEFARLYQNTLNQPGAAPEFTVSGGGNLFVGAGVRRIERANLNDIGADDVAVVGETVGGSSAFASGNPDPTAGGRLLEVTAIPPDCIADLTGDDRVDSSDLGVLLGAWGSGGVADINGDDVVDSADLAMVLTAWGNCPS